MRENSEKKLFISVTSKMKANFHISVFNFPEFLKINKVTFPFFCLCNRKEMH